MTDLRAVAEKLFYDTEFQDAEQAIKTIESILREVVLDDRMERTADEIYKLTWVSALKQAAKICQKYGFERQAEEIQALKP